MAGRPAPTGPLDPADRPAESSGPGGRVPLPCRAPRTRPALSPVCEALGSPTALLAPGAVAAGCGRRTVEAPRASRPPAATPGRPRRGTNPRAARRARRSHEYRDAGARRPRSPVGSSGPPGRDPPSPADPPAGRGGARGHRGPGRGIRRGYARRGVPRPGDFLCRLAVSARRPGFAPLVAETTVLAGCTSGSPVDPDDSGRRAFGGTLREGVQRLASRVRSSSSPRPCPFRTLSAATSPAACSSVCSPTCTPPWGSPCCIPPAGRGRTPSRPGAGRTPGRSSGRPALSPPARRSGRSKGRPRHTGDPAAGR